MSIRTRKREKPKPRRRLIAVAVVVLAALGGVAVFALNSGFPTGTPTAAPDATIAPTATAKPVTGQLDTAYVGAKFRGWQRGDRKDTTTFNAEAGNPKDGRLALRITSPASSTSAVPPSLNQQVPVTPKTEYTFGAWIRGSAPAVTPAGVAAVMGTTASSRFDFAPAGATWTHQTWAYKTSADQTVLPLSLVSTGPDTDVSVDMLTMTAAGSTDNLLANSSFEKFTAPTQITNSSLILTTGQATIGVSWKIPAATWTVADVSGKTVDHGKVALGPGLGVVSLKSLSPGYYSIALANPKDAADKLHTSLAILDPLKANQTATDARFGVGIHFTPAYVGSGATTAQLGISTVRTDAKWNKAEIKPGQYDFPVKESVMVQDYTDAGLTFLPISDYGNKLYDEGRTPSTPAGINAYGAYTQALVEHYKSPAVEVYNEFNNPPLNTSACGTTAACYLPLLKAGAAAVKATHPDTLIVGPATAHQDDPWLSALYAAGGLDYLDAITFHPYDYNRAKGPEFIEASLKQAVNRIKEHNNGHSKPIWITELGWTTASYNEKEQADNLVRAETISLANDVEKFFWYDLVNDHEGATHHEGNFGLLRQVSDRVPAFAPKPSGVAQAVLIRKVSGKTFSSRDALGNSSTYSYAFGTGSTTTRIAWATTPKTVTYAATADVTLTDQYGLSRILKPVNGRITVKLSGHPIYLDGALTDAQPAR